ncbi:hypothetical protein TWF696_002860 [Orbilia brochopaga]|uniref:Uncharacterized protein n=1 Tax=Orbilia brochopaga TaxID=3140254 RepID=A0AAV9U2W7_9PEZI
MESIAEADEPVETIRGRFQFPPSTPTASSLASPAVDVLPTSNIDDIATPVKTPRRRTYDPDAFTPLKDIPRDKYTDQEPLRSWKNEYNQKKPKCNFVECFPLVLEDYNAGHQQRPSLARSQSTTGVDVEGELSRSNSLKESRSGSSSGVKASFSHKLAAAERTHHADNSENENAKTGTQPITRKNSALRRLFRAKTLPIENHAPEKVSLVSFGPPASARGPVEVSQSNLKKPFETRLCDGCCRYITMTKKQYVCSDLGCKKRLCDRCYHIMEDAHDRGHSIDTKTLQTAHTAAEFRERCVKGILSSKEVPAKFKRSFVGAASAYEVGHAITHQNATFHTGAKDDPGRTRYLNLARLEEFFGREEVEMTLRPSSATVDSTITADTGPMRFQRLSAGSTDDAWGWKFAAEKRKAAAAGRTAPALPAVELQPPTLRPTLSPASPTRTIVVSPLSRSDSSTTDDSVSTLAL